MAMKTVQKAGRYERADEIKLRRIALGWGAKKLDGLANAILKERHSNQQMSPGYTRDIERGQSASPGHDQVEAIFEALSRGEEKQQSINNVSASGRAESHGTSQTAPVRPEPFAISVNEADIYLGGGTDLAMRNVRILGEWQLRADWLKSELRTNEPDEALIVTLEGDEMTPTLNPGEKVIVDRGRRTGPRGIFIIGGPTGPLAQRLSFLRTTPITVRVTSDNRFYAADDAIVPLDGLQILGRVMGRWGRM